MTHQSPVTRAMDDSIALELNRLWAMNAAWDEAADALGRLDFTGCDAALARFNQLSTARERGRGNTSPSDK